MKKKTKSKLRVALKGVSFAFVVSAFIYSFAVTQGLVGKMNYLSGFNDCKQIVKDKVAEQTVSILPDGVTEILNQHSFVGH